MLKELETDARTTVVVHIFEPRDDVSAQLNRCLEDVASRPRAAEVKFVRLENTGLPEATRIDEARALPGGGGGGAAAAARASEVVKSGGARVVS